MNRQIPDSLFVVGDCEETLASNQVPQFGSVVMTARNQLRFKLLSLESGDDMVMSSQHMDLGPSPDVPETDSAVSATTGQDVQSRVLGQRVHSTQVTMVATHHLVVLQVPTLHTLVFPTRI